MITTLCMPDLPARDETEIVESQAQEILDALSSAVCAPPALDPSLIRPLTLLSCALLAERADGPARQREAVLHIREAMLNRGALPLWVVRRGLLHPAQWVRDWVAKTLPDAGEQP